MKASDLKHPMVWLCLLLAAMMAFEGCKSSKGGDKAEMKRWRDKAKAYKKNPMALKAKEEGCAREIAELTEKNAELQQRVKDLEKQLEECVSKYEAELRKRDARYDSLMYEFKKVQTAFEASRTQVEPTAVNEGSRPVQPSQPAQTVERGVVFRVQIGAYQKFKIDDRLANSEKNFSGEYVDGLNKYLIGRFRSYDLAKEFRQDIIKLGIKDAFVVGYVDGVRVSIQEAQRRAR